MDRPTLARAAAVGLLLTVLVSLFVLQGSGWVLADPAQRTNTVADTTQQGTVVDTDPVTVAYGDGQQVVLPTADDAAVGDTVDVSLTVSEAGTTTDITAQPGQRLLMYLVSALAGLLVLGRVLDTWRLRPLDLRAEPRERPLHTNALDRYHGRHTTHHEHTPASHEHDQAATDGGRPLPAEDAPDG